MNQNHAHIQTATQFATGAAGALLGLLCLPSVLRDSSRIDILWPAVSIVGAMTLTAVTWIALKRVSSSATYQGKWMGLFVIFGQAIDAVSTAVAIDILSFSEQVPLSRAVMEIARELPTAPIIGVSWLFVVLKITLAVGLVWLLATDSEMTPLSTRVLFLGAGLAGFIPGIQNMINYVFL